MEDEDVVGSKCRSAAILLLPSSLSEGTGDAAERGDFVPLGVTGPMEDEDVLGSERRSAAVPQSPLSRSEDTSDAAERGDFVLQGVTGPTEDEDVAGSERTSAAVPLSPLLLTRAKKVRSAAWVTKVQELSERGVALRDMLGFYARLGTDNGPMPHFSPERSTTNDVVRSAIIPESRDYLPTGSSRDQLGLGNCALAMVLNGGQGKMPQKIVTHHWQNLFSHTMAAIVADALDEPSYSSVVQKVMDPKSVSRLLSELAEKGQLDLVYWLCAVSVNQHCSICGGCVCGRSEKDTVLGTAFEACHCGTPKYSAGDLCEMNKFSDMMDFLCREVPNFGQVVAVDRHFVIFSRAWCIAELAQANVSGMAQSLKFHSRDSVDEYRHSLTRLDVRACKASREEDREEILAMIPDIECFNQSLRDMLLNSDTGLLQLWSQAYAAGRDLAVRWDTFSQTYTDRLQAASTHDPSPVLAVFLVPLALCIGLYALPLQSPDEGWEANVLFWSIQLPCVALFVNLLLPHWFLTLAAIPWSWYLETRLVVWVLVITFAQCCAILGVAVHLDTMPAPFSMVIGTLTHILLLPGYWWAVPQSARADAAIRCRLLCAVGTLAAICTVFGLGYPILMAWFMALEAPGQAGVVFIFLLSRLVFEGIGICASQFLGADVLPVIVFLSISWFEWQMGVVLARAAHWAIVIEMVAVNVLENLYFLWGLRQQGHGAEQAAGRQRVKVVLLTRECTEAIASAQCLLVHVALYYARPEFNGIVSGLSHGEFLRAVTYVGVDATVEVASLGVTCAVLWRQGEDTLRMLRGTVAINFPVFFFSSCASGMFVLTTQHTHYGFDVSL